MAKTENTAPSLPDFQEGTAYEVKMARSVEYPTGTGNWLRPGDKVTVDGAVASDLKEYILDARNAEAP